MSFIAELMGYEDNECVLNQKYPECSFHISVGILPRNGERMTSSRPDEIRN